VLPGGTSDAEDPGNVRPVVLGIGIGVPKANYYRGMVENPPNLSWKGITPLAALLKERFGLPVVITNDANRENLPALRARSESG
jgi:predicted NBD/HSP70 family sugar kinase